MPIEPIKRGSTFFVTVTYSPRPTDPADLSAVTVTSAVQTGQGVTGKKTDVATVAVANDNLSFTVVIPAATTALWALGKALWDVKFIYTGGASPFAFFADTEEFEVTENITP